MKYKVEKDDSYWYGYKWDESIQRWCYIENSISLTKLGCKYFVKKYHKKSKESLGCKSEEFELE